MGRKSQSLPMEKKKNNGLERVLEQLRLYEHPLLAFDAREKGDSVEVIIRFKNPDIPVHTYYFDLHPRDLEHPQFEWTFQRQLYDCLHRSEEHTSELQSHSDLVCRLLLEKKKK